jgi:Holliday junction resolvase-like predicted endonuclease
VEVKVVNYIENLHDYITPKKLQKLKHTIETYLWKYPTKKIVRIDVVFVKDNKIIEIFKNIEI